MTVSTEVTRVIVEGNGVTTAFSYTFPIPGSSSTDQTNAELILLGTDSSITTLADNLWSMTGVGTDVGGTFTYPLSGSPVTTGAFLTLNRIVPYLQNTSLSAQGAYSPEVVEAALDNLAFQTEQLNTRALQTVRAPITDAALSDLPTAVKRANSFLFFNDNGDVSTASSTAGMPSAIYVGTDSTHANLTNTLLLTGAGVTSVVTLLGVTTASIPGLTVTDGTHTASNASIINFTAGATVTDSTGSTASVSITGGGGGGGVVFLEAHTASSSASLDFTTFISGTYDDYMVEIVGLVPQTSTANLFLEIGTGGGPTYDTGNNYEWAAARVAVSNTVSTAPGGTTGPAIIFDSMGATSGWAGNMSFRIMNLQSTTLRKSFFGIGQFISSSPNNLVIGGWGGSWNTTATAATALRFIMSSGNIVSGTIRIYGLAKS